jgi:hypothetical protein
MKNLSFLLMFSIALFSNAQEANFPKEINLVFDYIVNNDFPELFNGQPFQPRPIAWQIIDIDNDGKTEVFLQTFPHYRQSPTISIFKIDNKDSVTRIIEGFAPGHLVKLSAEDDYFDTHSTGTAVDMQLDSNEPEKFKKLAQSSLNFGMSVVLYKNFIHMDKRDGKEIFIDLMYLNDFPNENSCAHFQFSQPEQIIAGKIKNMKALFFISKVNKELFCYKIKGFENGKFVDKEIFIMKLPKKYKQLILDDGFIKYKNKKGEIRELDIKNGV